MKTVIFLAILVLAVFAIVIPQLRLRSAGRAGAYKSRPLMTDNEAEFFGRLVVALPEHYIFPQVAMSALIEPASRDQKKAHSDRLRVAQQRVDYLVCDRNCKIVAVVELDDKTHSRTKDQARDARLQQGGIRTVRFQSKSKPSVDVIRSEILPTPVLPEVTKTLP